MTASVPLRFYATASNYATHLEPIAAELGLSVSRGVDRPKPGEWVVVAGASDLEQVPRSCRVALAEHGAGQTYVGVDHRSWAGGRGRDAVSLFLCPRQDVLDANLSRYRQATGAVVGCPALDVFAGGRSNRTEQTVAFTFHPEYPAGRACPELRSALPHYLDALPAIVGELRENGVRVVGHRHPRYRTLKNLWRNLGVEFCDDWPGLLGSIDCLVADNTSALPEAAAVGAGTVWLRSPEWRPEVIHGGRFYEWERFGTPVSGPSEVVAAVMAELSRPFPRSQQEAVEGVYGGVWGNGAALAGEAIREWADLP